MTYREHSRIFKSKPSLENGNNINNAWACFSNMNSNKNNWTQSIMGHSPRGQVNISCNELYVALNILHSL